MNIRLFYWYRITGQLLPIYPVYLLLFQSKGLSLAQISALLVIWGIPTLVLEVPSSVLADHWNRRNLLVLGRLLKAACFGLWAFADGFTGFALGFLVWGAGGAICSGTEEAWLYDCLDSQGLALTFDRVWGRSTFYYQLMVGLASVIGSLIASVSMVATLWLSVTMTLVSAGCAARLDEYNHHRTVTEDSTPGGYLRTLRTGIHFCWTHGTVSLLMGFSMTVLVTAGILDEYDQLIVRQMGIPLALVGTWGLIRYGLEALGGRMAWRMKQLGRRLGFQRTFEFQLTLAVGSAVCLMLAAGYPVLWLLPLYGLYYALQAVDKVLFTDTLQQEIQQQGRATIQSFASLTETFCGMLICALFGSAGGQNRLQSSMLVVGVWILLWCLAFWGLHRRKIRDLSDSRAIQSI